MNTFRILLLGEFSSLYSYLKDGLLKLGYDVQLLADGDGWKKIPGADGSLSYLASGECSSLKKASSFIKSLNDRRLSGYDIVQAVTPEIFSYYINYFMFKKLKRENDKLFISSAGSNFIVYDSYKRGDYGIDYYWFDNNVKQQTRLDDRTFKVKIKKTICNRIFESAYGIIPMIPYEYSLPFKKFPNLRNSILLPINTDKIEYHPNIAKDKIVFFHGISRSDDKGSNYILEAMRIIQDRYPEIVECVSAERMPFNEYVKVISRANVILDQCKSYGYGMNCGISLAQGKIVMSGAEQKFLEEGKITNCPVVNIVPDVDDIVRKMEDIIHKKNYIEEWGWNCRHYIEKYHNYVRIAQQYVDEWKK